MTQMKNSHHWQSSFLHLLYNAPNDHLEYSVYLLCKMWQETLHIKMQVSKETQPTIIQLLFCKRDRSTFTYPHLLRLIWNFKKLPSNLWFSNCMYTTHILQIVIPQLEKWFLNCKCWASKLQPCNLKIANDGKRPSP